MGRVEVEAEDAEGAIEVAHVEHGFGLCAQCAGWGEKWSAEVSDELEPETVRNLDTDKVEFDAKQRWTRVPDEN